MTQKFVTEKNIKQKSSSILHILHIFHYDCIFFKLIIIKYLQKIPFLDEMYLKPEEKNLFYWLLTVCYIPFI